jgi:membrane-bound lytic murein transglycosylase B
MTVFHATPVFRLVIALGLLAAPVIPPLHAQTHPGQAALVREVVRDTGKSAAALNRLLDGATRQQSILDAISRPAEAKPWRDYRPIFMTDQRIADGVAFYREHRALLEQVGRQYGVAPEYIVAILGVETNYGRLGGKYKVLDALVTLGLYYPPRAKFFRDFAVDADHDGRIDLRNSLPDIFASVANYFAGHGWVRGGPVAMRAQPDSAATPITVKDSKPQWPLEQLEAWGYAPLAPANPGEPSSLQTLDGAAGPEYWFTFQNFYVITTYNRSPLYAMAVHQLAQAIDAGVQQADATQ